MDTGRFQRCWCCLASKYENKTYARVDTWCIFLCSLGAFFCLLSTFLTSWRVDSIGTTPISEHWDYEKWGFDSKGYGIIYIKGSHQQPWTSIAQSACEVRKLGQISGMASSAIKAVVTG